MMHSCRNSDRFYVRCENGNTKFVLKHGSSFDFMNWKKAWLILIGSLVSLVTILTLFTYTIQIAFDGMCGNKFLSEKSSPDRIYRAVVFQRDCGATTGFSTQVSILKAEERLPNQSGNLFIADTDRGKAPSGIGGGPDVRISWIDPRSIRLIHHKNTRVFLANPRVAEVSAKYDSFN